MVEFDRAGQPVNILTREIFYNTTVINFQNTGTVKGYIWSGQTAQRAVARIGKRQMQAYLERVIQP